MTNLNIESAEWGQLLHIDDLCANAHVVVLLRNDPEPPVPLYMIWASMVQCAAPDSAVWLEM